ncbi:MAG: hypothetical protein A2381_13395 [Bdellovibrionales bacterium RIFOXYB1_FULL_37_110]|nr:MAG: hypothetical protein A2381_13395 [Bdellovibrionales bacterium RIFOXYB1_FULL_37_110]OFZ65098.1 MAG: hypothetical protein A2577_09660 [Bdellovibrionales bacterium RIFOXYD1_FULL_36_51]
MKLIRLILILFITFFYSCDGNNEYVNFQIFKDVFTFSGQAPDQSDRMEALQGKYFLPEYENSFLEITWDSTQHIYFFNLVISFKDYQANKTESLSWDYNNLPGGRPLPGIFYYGGGGSGVGNGYLPTQETFWDYGLIRIYQLKDKFGVFMSMPTTIGDNSIISMVQRSKKHKLNISYVGKTSSDSNDDGILILMDKVVQPKAQDVLGN